MSQEERSNSRLLFERRLANLSVQVHATSKCKKYSVERVKRAELMVGRDEVEAEESFLGKVHQVRQIRARDDFIASGHWR